MSRTKMYDTLTLHINFETNRQVSLLLKITKVYPNKNRQTLDILKGAIRTEDKIIGQSKESNVENVASWFNQFQVSTNLCLETTNGT